MTSSLRWYTAAGRSHRIAVVYMRVQSNPGITARKLGIACGVGHNAALRYLKILEVAGYVRHDGTGKNSMDPRRYHIVEGVVPPAPPSSPEFRAPGRKNRRRVLLPGETSYEYEKRRRKEDHARLKRYDVFFASHPEILELCQREASQ